MDLSKLVGNGTQNSLQNFSLSVTSSLRLITHCSLKFHTTILLVNVDDIVLTGDDLIEINSVRSILAVEDKYHGNIIFFLGMDCIAGISFNQWKYALELLEDAGLLA